ncbi:M20/M25/M40 family metallo-hydrolase [Streptomyces sp. Amel2xC10]|uniref:M20/M25/M40 family metallo-hydrolase n=1 Tax=Streptomyces sp. Amel2xC10 TaxID=1305826 RepID=UPI000A08AA55|nr:M20/M25/M40 family metallo-hydrolase [Streptomyces sp. Amel2xC10]SMF78591.1 glutamate carboxypeptidase [Streptomyces sp. Amel2xC10]
MADPTELLALARTFSDTALERWSHLVSLETPSGDADRAAVFGKELAAGLTATADRVEQPSGPGGDHLVAYWNGRETADDDRSAGHTLLVAHSDTVFPAGTVARRPFTLAEDGDTVTGPGVFDMKGSLVAVELAMDLLSRTGTTPRRPVRLVVVNDEEIGSPDGSRLVARHAEGAHAVLGLEPPLPGGALKIGRRGVARVRLRVRGVSAHAGLDAALGVSAIDELVDQLARMRATAAALPDAALNVGTISGGTRANVVADHAEAEIGLRYATAATERALMSALLEPTPVRERAGLTAEKLSHRPAWALDPANPLAAELTSLAAALGLDLPLGSSGGAGDTNLTGALGIPTVDGLGPAGAGAHGEDEHASLSSLLERAALVATYLNTH